jgi:alpha-galactosidase
VSSGAASVRVGPPDVVLAQREPRDAFVDPARAGVRVGTAPDGDALRVSVAAAERVSRVVLRWRRPPAPGVRVLGDAWERSYGDLEWRGLVAERPLPWSVVAHEPSGRTWGLGVAVRGAALAFWTVDDAGVTLWLDLRSGSAPLRPGDREVPACVVHGVAAEPPVTPFAAQRALSALLCRDPLPVGPVAGGNTWYYTYGRGLTGPGVVRDAAWLAGLVADHPVRPYYVVDDGWSPGGLGDGGGSGGPWDRGRRGAFDDMAAVAAGIRAAGARPGIWFRPLLLRDVPRAGRLGGGPGGWTLDPSHPATLARVHDDVARLRAWGFDLVKHDFSTFDVLRRWGYSFGPFPSESAPPLADDACTTAEAFGRLYRAVRHGAQDVVVVGCNAVGHLAAGLVEAQRTGDDTSGQVWGRTRRMGVNTLAFRLAQHRAFFAVDPDCAPITPLTDRRLDLQWLDLVARSGTVLFASVDPAVRAEVEGDVAAALRLALDGGAPGGVEPLDWTGTTSPVRWRSGDGEVRYDWSQAFGGDPFEFGP